MMMMMMMLSRLLWRSRRSVSPVSVFYTMVVIIAEEWCIPSH